MMGEDIGDRGNAVCPACGERFACGAQRGHCWCAALPRVLPMPGEPDGRCYCPRCLMQRIEDRARRVPPG
jgi:hypothetical protein